MSTNYTIVIFMSIFCMLSIQLCIFNSTTLNKRQKRFFYMFFSTIIVSAFCEWLGLYLQGTGPSTRLLHIVVKCIELSLAPSICFWFSWVIEKKHQKFVWAYLIVHALIEILSGIFGFVYCVDEYSNYIHGEFYWIYVAAYIFPLIYCIYITLKNIKKYQYNGISYYISTIAFMMTGIVVQLCNHESKIVYLTAAIASVMMYIFTLEMIHRTDELTGLINRRGYENIIVNIENKCNIIFFDIDNFKGVNDTFGHTEGDAVLRKVGKILREKYAKHGNCFRFGGDEFCVILRKNIEQTEALNDEFMQAIKQQMKYNKGFPDVSLGYAEYDPETGDIRKAMAEADKIMYRQKAAHKKANPYKFGR